MLGCDCVYFSSYKRQAKAYRRTLTQTLTNGRYGATVRFNDDLGDGQAQPRATHLTTAGWVDAVEAVKDVGEMFGRNPIPIIGDLHTGGLPLLPKPQVNTTVGMAQPVCLL